MLNNIRIVLINTFHPGNIGAAARAMKNMGLSNLVLVDPQRYPDEEATNRAAGATDILESAKVVSTLREAIEDCQLVIATSARTRSSYFNLPLIDARSAAVQAIQESKDGSVAIVFGRETMGLHNDEIKQCNLQLYIRANPEYPVLNVAQAIQLVCYEIWSATEQPAQEASQASYPDQKEMGLFYQHLERVLRRTNFIIPQHEGRAMEKLRRYFNRSRPEKMELGMLRGILASVDEVLDKEPKQQIPNKKV